MDFSHIDTHTFYHIGLGAAITSAYILLVEEPKWQDFVFIGGFVMGVGFMKECHDQAVGGAFDPGDLVANGVGVGLGIGLTWRLK